MRQQRCTLIPLLVPEHNIPIGEEQWASRGLHRMRSRMQARSSASWAPSASHRPEGRTQGCGPKSSASAVAAVKKIEGNPLDPISGGRLCARGQAVVQALYHPDRLQGAMKRQGDRGKSQFTSVSWDDAIAGVSDKIKSADPSRIVFLTGPNAGSRSIAIQQFLKAIKAPAATVCSLSDHAIERQVPLSRRSAGKASRYTTSPTPITS